MVETNHTSDWCYFRAKGRSLAAVEAHRHAVIEAIEDVQAFVVLCGAERALGGSRVSGLHFRGELPPGWISNITAPHMAIPDTNTTRGISLQRKLAELRIPSDAEFAHMIGAQALPNTNNPNAPVISVTWPSYHKLTDGWGIQCPKDSKGTYTTPPDAMPMSREDYARLSVTPSFNLLALDSETSTDH